MPTIQNSQEVDPTSCIVPLDESGEGKDVGTDFPKAVVNFSVPRFPVIVGARAVVVVVPLR